MGDGRTYEQVALRAVATDFMTADWAELPYEPAEEVLSGRIINEVRGINRVVYDISASRRRLSSGNDAAMR